MPTGLRSETRSLCFAPALIKLCKFDPEEGYGKIQTPTENESRDKERTRMRPLLVCYYFY